jgi:hypothetical protein
MGWVKLPHAPLFKTIIPANSGTIVGLEGQTTKGLKRIAPQALAINGGVDETRTRDLRRDRPAF